MQKYLPRECESKEDLFFTLPDGSKHLETISYYFPPPFFSENIPVSWHQMIYRFPSIRDSFNILFQKWISQKCQYESVFHLYLAATINPKQHLEVRFLTFAQAIELIHRRTHRGQFVTKEEFSPIKNHLRSNIPEALSDDFKERISTGIGHMNEFSLKERIDELVSELKNRDIWIPENDWARKIKDTRNYLAHFSEEQKEKAAHGWDLYNLIIVARYLLEATVLKNIGMSDDVIKALREKRLKDFIQKKDA